MEKQLESDLLLARARFIEDRERGGAQAYRAAFARNEPVVRRLLEISDDLLLFTGEILREDPELVEAARYLAGPPISRDDLRTLVGGRLGRRINQEVAAKLGGVLKAGLDPIRFPWLSEGRRPEAHERETAIGWTAGIWATEQLRTLWRIESSHRQEKAVADVLRQADFEQRERVRTITSLDDLQRGMFAREAVLAGSKCDVPIRLLDGRLLALECKVSNSSLNSVKRLVRETGGKARRWDDAFGQQVITGVVLAGVYKLVNLRDAQENYGIAIFWEHDLTPLRQFVLDAK